MDKCGNCWKNLDKALISVRKVKAIFFFFSEMCNNEVKAVLQVTLLCKKN